MTRTKQHITNRQLNELSRKGNEKLTEWVYKRLDPADKLPGNTINLLLSIGQMIGFLEKEIPSYHIARWQHFEGQKPYWLIKWTEGRKPRTINYEFKSKILCDALWEATKEKLEK